MRLVELLNEIGGLGVYESAEWEEYLEYFEGEHEVGNCRKEPSTRETSELARRISSGKGAQPQHVDFAISPKIVPAEALAADDARAKMTLGMVSGAFDLLHLGHLRSFRDARRVLEDRSNAKLCVMVLSDQHIRDKKGPSRPILSLNERLALIAAVHFVDYAIPLEQPNCLTAIESLRPELLIKSAGDTEQPIVREEAELVRSLSGEVEWLSTDGVGRRSTTSVVDSVIQQHTESTQLHRNHR